MIQTKKISLIKNKIDITQVNNYLIVLYAFFLPISYFMTNNLSALILVLFLFSGDLKKKILFAFQNKVVQAFLIFYFMHIVWLIGSDNLIVATTQIRRFVYILYIIIFVATVKKSFVKPAISAFLLAMVFSELTSYLISLQIIPPINHATIANPVPFMLSHINYSSLLAVSLAIVLYLFFVEKRRLSKIILCIFFISATINLFIINSRMGYILYLSSIFTVLIVIYRTQIVKFTVMFLLFSSLSYILAYNFSSSFHNRVNLAVNSITKAYTSKDYSTSSGIRIGYWIYSYKIVQRNLLFGVGAGDHIDMMNRTLDIYEQNVKNQNNMKHCISSGSNASLHSEYLDTIVQFGIIGLIIFLNIFYQLYKYRQENLYLKTIQYILVISSLVMSIPSPLFIHTTVAQVLILLISLTLHTYDEHNNKRVSLHATSN